MGPEQPICNPQAAEILEERTDEILEDYVRRLRLIESPLVRESPVAQIEAQAVSVLRETAKTLRAGQGPGRQEPNNTSMDIGTSRARANIRPSESLKAVGALSGAALDLVADHLPPSNAPRSEITGIALVLQEVIFKRVAYAAISYVDYLLRKVHEGQAEERRRMSRELHDRVNHSLAIVCKSLELYEALREDNSPKAEDKARFAREVAEDALKSATELLQELRSSKADAGLEVALSDLLHTRISRDVEAWVSIKGEERQIPAHIRDELFLVLREAVRNANSHSAAGRIVVEVIYTQYRVTAKVVDDGRGFDPEAARQSRDGGIGLKSMEERMALMGGQCRVESRRTEGTRVTVEVPLAPLPRG